MTDGVSLEEAKSKGETSWFDGVYLELVERLTMKVIKYPTINFEMEH